ncbi:sulfurtransferase [Salinicola corii]|uniref:Sulfurtransferase n=1 Tax=Salinicola corii TaxID=2606937 RepID=A0A640WFW5_9GAMM|nr:sulfurtransferase [Salinicola corii]KAA0019133.1 sulfurtransferase [Salinicola corii]
MNASVLVTVEELQRSLVGDRPPLVLDCRARLDDASAGKRLWRESHIPGSHQLDMDRDLSSPPGDGGRHPLPSPEAFTTTIQCLGIQPHRAVVVYDDKGGQLSAARAWWMLACWARHPDVRVLDGGLPAWQAAGGELATNESISPLTSRWRPDFDHTVLISARDLLEDGGLLVDARGEARFRGDEEPIDAVAGHIPGAACRPSSTNLDATGHFKSPRRLAEELPRADSVTAYCGSGVTACHNILAYAIAGLPLPRLYAGSWSEWIRDPARPVATGD